MTDLRSRIAHLLAEQHGSCLPSHWRTADRVLAEVEADRLRAELRASTRFDPAAADDAMARARALLDAPQAPSTPAPVAAPPEPSSGPHAGAQALSLGLWVDDAPGLVLSEAYLERLHALGLDEIAVMLERSGPGYDARWRLEQLRALRGATSLPLSLVVWPEPSRVYLARLRVDLPLALEASGAESVELDLEGQWKRGKLLGYPSLQHAGDALYGVLHAIGAPYDVTTFPSHLEADARGAVRGERRLWLQSYAVAEARGEAREWAGRLGPERRAREDLLAAAGRIEPGVELAVGLAAWSQSWPGEDPAEAMRLSLAGAVEAGVSRVRWWSSRWVIGAHATGYGAGVVAAARTRSA